MKALKWFGQKDIRIVEAEKPVPGKGEVLVKVMAAGICGTDLHEYEAGPIFIPVTPHPITGKKAPVILGHEFSGIIETVGEGVTGWAEGDHVTADACIACGECAYCKQGSYNLCDNLGFTGLADDGAFAEYIRVPAYQLYKLAPGMSFEAGAVIEPAAVGVHAVKKGRLSLGESVVIIGAGTIGLATLQAAKAAGATAVYVIETAGKRKEFAKKLGADMVIDPLKTDPVEEIKKLTEGLGADLTVECAGLDITMSTAISVTRKGGRIVVAGIFSKPGDGLPLNDMVIGEKEIIGSIAYKDDFKATIDLVSSGAIEAMHLITAEISLEDIIEKGFIELIENKENHIKILVKP